MEPRLNPRLRHTINSQCRETTCTLVDNRQQMTLGVSQCALRVTPGKQALSSLYRQPSGKPRVEGTPPGETTKKQQRDVSFTLTLTAAPASRLHAGSTSSYHTWQHARRQQARHFIIAVPLTATTQYLRDPSTATVTAFTSLLSDRPSVTDQHVN